ncbi:hypothetical protein MTHERMMSTA1_15640 [Methanosarcina thermophila MST-A1]|uniref:LICD family protein n=1 Tax=Methanosarcina thermophila TaxID=2210 RepID=A0A3G9CQ72_METTE|nr:MAG: hypothetical protein AAY43_00050 [Methanosarcina sp. 795]BAW27988.1 LICD family protein [Methanosarcina thermophila]GLI14438.1 hypothetical protein MTHERMMSTA1_15640 [Methanosarcina thermophila MST-A1]
MCNICIQYKIYTKGKNGVRKLQYKKPVTGRKQIKTLEGTLKNPKPEKAENGNEKLEIVPNF